MIPFAYEFGLDLARLWLDVWVRAGKLRRYVLRVVGKKVYVSVEENERTAEVLITPYYNDLSVLEPVQNMTAKFPLQGVKK